MNVQKAFSNLGSAGFKRLITKSTRIAQSDFRLHENEVLPAVRFVEAIREGCRSSLIASPMQSGKTQIMASICIIMCELSRDIRKVFICANDQVSL